MHLITIQNGSHPSPPINPVLAALQDLQNEVQDIVVGFETRLRRIRRNGERSFGGVPDTQEQPEDETISILPIEDDTPKRTDEGESPAPPPVVIGRGAQEIVSALDRAAEQEAQAALVAEGKSRAPEKVVESLAHEVTAEETVSSTPHPRHNEL